jgi:hypothetical protein
LLRNAVDWFSGIVLLEQSREMSALHPKADICGATAHVC